MIVYSELEGATVIGQALIKPGYNTVRDNLFENRHFKALIQQKKLRMVEWPNQKTSVKVEIAELTEHDKKVVDEVLNAPCKEAIMLARGVKKKEVLDAIVTQEKRFTVLNIVKPLLKRAENAEITKLAKEKKEREAKAGGEEE